MADYAHPDMGGILSRALSWGEAAAATVVVAAASLTRWVRSGVERVPREHRRHEFRHDIFHRQGGSPPCRRPWDECCTRQPTDGGRAGFLRCCRGLLG